MRRAANIDGNQTELVGQCRGYGISVLHTHQLGKGAPDLVLGWQGRNYLVEVKDPKKPPSKRRLTTDELKFHAEWNGQCDVVMDISDILHLIDHPRAD